MDSEERGALWLVPPIIPPAGVNHLQMKGTDRMQLQVVPKIPFEVFNRLLPSFIRHSCVRDLPFHCHPGRSIRVATETHFEVAAGRAGTDAESKTARPFRFH